MNLFVTGIGTNVGKTIVSAVLTEALQADYWKPIQSGTIDGLDSDTVRSLISNTKTIIHPESYLLKQPLSPNIAAGIEGIDIKLSKILLPLTYNHLIIEGAGGLLVPVNKTNCVIDIAKQMDCEIVVVISDYLGCINHSLLSMDYLVRNNFKIFAVVFNGNFSVEVKNTLLHYISGSKIMSVPKLNSISQHCVSEAALSIKVQL